MTVLLGPTPCATCKEPVTVVRRPVIVWCDEKCRACAARKGTYHRFGVSTSVLQTAMLNPSGSEHVCSEVNARSLPMGYDEMDGSSVASSDTIGNGRVSARPRNAAVPCLEGLAP